MATILMQVIGDDGDVLADGEWKLGHVGYEELMLDTFANILVPVTNGLFDTLKNEVHAELGVNDEHEEPKA